MEKHHKFDKRVGWNKRDGRKNLKSLINVLDGIIVMVGKQGE